MKVCMFVINNCLHDARVLKEAKTLADAGFDVRVIAKLDKDTRPFERKDGFRIIRVLVIRLSFLRRLPRIPAEPRYTACRDTGGTAQWRSSQVGLLSESISQSTTNRVRKFLKSMLARLSRPIRRPLSYLDFSYLSWRAIKNEPADVYHSHDLNTLLVGWFAKRRTGGKLVYDAHELFIELANVSCLERPVYKLLERRLIYLSDAVIVPGAWRGNHLSEKYGISLPTIILNCPLLAGGQLHTYSLREKLGVSDTEPVIIYTGGYSPGRGLKNLITSAPYLDRGIIIFMGWGPLEQELKELVRVEHLEEKVLFTEPVTPEEIVGHITTASIGVVIYQNTCLNNYYASSNKLFEYMHAGLPVVCSDFPALKEIVESYQLGKTFDPDDPESIAEAINYVLAGNGKYNEMRRNALEAAKIFNWENESKKLLALYEGLGYRTND